MGTNDGSNSPIVDYDVKVYTQELEADPHAVRAPRISVEALTTRSQEVVAAINSTTNMLATANTATQHGDWAIEEIEATFSIALGIEAGVLISKGSVDATLEVRVLMRRAAG